MIAHDWGVGEITAVMMLAETGDARRFRNGDAMVRYTGLDVTVHSSDGKRGPGLLARQGPAALRWALYEAAKSHSRAGAPHLDLYRHAKQRKGGKRATLTVARKLAREIRHTLIGLGDHALAPVDADRLPPCPSPPRPRRAPPERMIRSRCRLLQRHRSSCDRAGHGASTQVSQDARSHRQPPHANPGR